MTTLRFPDRLVQHGNALLQRPPHVVHALRHSPAAALSRLQQQIAGLALRLVPPRARAVRARRAVRLVQLDALKENHQRLGVRLGLVLERRRGPQRRRRDGPRRRQRRHVLDLEAEPRAVVVRLEV